MKPPAQPVRVSWSMLRVAEECRQKAHLFRAGKRSDTSNVRNYFHGNVVDRAMRDWLADPGRQPGQMAAGVTELIDRLEAEARLTGDGVVRWRHLSDRADVHEFCTELLTVLEPILYDLVVPYEFESATRFKVPVTVPYLDGTPTTIILSGETDLLVQNDGWRVFDLKGTRDNDYWRKVVGQLVFYDLYILARTGQPTREVALIQPLCNQPVMPFTVTNDARQALWARILRYVGDVWRDEAPCKDGTGGCAYCEVKHACPRYADVGNLMGLGAGLRRAATLEGKASHG